MPPSYRDFTSTRPTEPDPVVLQAALRVIAPTAGYTNFGQVYRVKTATPLNAADIANVQGAIDTAAALTPQRRAQNEIEAWPISQRALALALIDKINDIDANIAALLTAVNALNTKTSSAQTTLPKSTAQVNDQQALNAIRNKAGTI